MEKDEHLLRSLFTGEGTAEVPENFVPFGYPLNDTEIPDVVLTKKDREFFDMDKWSRDWGEMWRDLAAFGIILNNDMGCATEFCKREIRAARNYAREGNVEMAEKYMARLEKVYPVARGRPLPKEITDNIRKKYPG